MTNICSYSKVIRIEIKREYLPLQMNRPQRKLEDSTLEAVEKAHIVEILAQNRWNITRSALGLGIDRVTLYNKIKKYGLKK